MTGDAAPSTHTLRHKMEPTPDPRPVVDPRRRNGPVQAVKGGLAAALQKALADAWRTGDPEAALRSLREKMGQGEGAAKVADPPAAVNAPLWTSRLAPGEVPKANNRLWLGAMFVAIVLLLHLGYGRSG